MNFLELISKYQKFIIYSILCLAVVSFFDRVLAIGFIFITFLCAITFLVIKKDKEQLRILVLLFLVVFLIHLVAVFFIYYAHFEPFGGYGDYNGYNLNAQKIAERVHQRNFSLKELEIGNYYPIIIGYIYALTVPSMLIGQIFNAWLVALLVIFVYSIVRQIGGSEKEGFLVGLIASIYPSLAFYGSLLLKDALVVLLCMIGLLLMLKIIRKFSWVKFFIFYIVLTGLIHFRFYIGYALMFSFIISWFLVSTFNLKKRIIYGIIMVFILGFCPQILGNGYYGFRNFERFLNTKTITYYREVIYAPSVQPSSVQLQPTAAQPTAAQPTAAQPTTPPPTTPQTFTYYDKSSKQWPYTGTREEFDAYLKRSGNTETTQPTAAQPTAAQPTAAQPTAVRSGRGSSILIKTGFENPIIFIKNTLLSFICSLLGPFPWQMKKLEHLFALPEVIAWYFLFFFIVKGIIMSIKKQYRIILPLVIFSIFVFGTLALYINNFGIITRIRIPAFLSLLCLFPFGFEKLKNIKIPLLSKIFNI